MLEYWIVDVDARVFECWRPGQQTPALHRERMVWAPSEGTGLEINVPDFFERVDRKLGRRAVS